jgi:hypothetical protein
MPVTLEIKASRDLARVRKNLGQFADGKKRRAQFTKEVRAEVTPVARALRSAYRSNPSKDQPNPPGRGDLRRLLARAVTVMVKLTGNSPLVRLKVDGRKMPSGMGGLPAMYEGRKRWRHKVFGRDRWVTQRPVPTFDRVVRMAAPRVRTRVNKVADDAMRDVAKG